jgi:WD40 repeat protein
VWDAATGQVKQTLEDAPSNTHCIMVFSPDGSKLALRSVDSTICVWNVVTGQTEHMLNGHSSDISDLAFSLDGGKLASGSCGLCVGCRDGKSRHYTYRPF